MPHILSTEADYILMIPAFGLIYSERVPTLDFGWIPGLSAVIIMILRFSRLPTFHFSTRQEA